ncbi:MAG: hypothetical protein FWE45_00995 [Firmicutes bacterium]|nr:hypothetical protein [Bacillota bacterium]
MKKVVTHAETYDAKITNEMREILCVTVEKTCELIQEICVEGFDIMETLNRFDKREAKAIIESATRQVSDYMKSELGGSFEKK